MPAFGGDFIPAATQAEEIAAICRLQMQAIDREIKEQIWRGDDLQRALLASAEVFPSSKGGDIPAQSSENMVPGTINKQHFGICQILLIVIPDAGPSTKHGKKVVRFMEQDT